ncbi:MAG: MFS transporter [Nitrospirota bacterium]
MKKAFGLSRNIYVAGIVSLLMDMSSEMIYPLMPLFLANVLGASKELIGLIEGVAESTASIVKIFSGWLSDKVGKRKGLTAGGYGISTLSRPIIALATGWHMVLIARFLDRVGKGVRTAPRDAIIAESTEPDRYGAAFGFHRAMDTFGAVIGPATAFILLKAFSGDFRRVFWVSMIPAALAVATIILFIKERDKSPADRKPTDPVTARGQLTGRSRPNGLSWSALSGRFRFFVIIAAVFSAGNSSDAFLILRAQQVGISPATIPLVYLLFNAIYSLISLPAGITADRFGRKRIILAGFFLFAAIYYGFARFADSRSVWLLFGAYGVFMGMTEGIQKAYLAEVLPSEFKATAFGIYSMMVGLALLPASIIGGWLWDHVSPAATFYYGAVMALISAGLFVVYIAVYGKGNRERAI